MSLKFGNQFMYGGIDEENYSCHYVDCDWPSKDSEGGKDDHRWWCWNRTDCDQKTGLVHHKLLDRAEFTYWCLICKKKKSTKEAHHANRIPHFVGIEAFMQHLKEEGTE